MGEEVSGMDELSVLVDFRDELLNRDSDNLTMLNNVNTRFVDFVNSAPTTGTSTKSMDFVADLVERVVNNQHFADLVLTPYVEPVPERVEEVRAEEPQQHVEENLTGSRKESQKQRDQQAIFMAEDDDDDQNDEDMENNCEETEEREDAQIIESKQAEPENTQVLKEQTTNKQVEKEKPKNLDDGEEEWVEVNKGRTNHYEKRENNYRGGGRGRGGRGRGGRGGNRDYNRDNRD